MIKNAAMARGSDALAITADQRQWNMHFNAAREKSS
jgi:hypothetical protein